MPQTSLAEYVDALGKAGLLTRIKDEKRVDELPALMEAHPDSRYIGLAKTGLQQACTSAAMNVSPTVNWLEQKPRAKTRTTRFAALAQAA